MLELIINDRKITVEEGTTILQAALRNGIKIPNLCYDKRLRPYGGCRLCVVEEEKSPRLLAACSSPCAQGMVVKTDTPKLRKVRQTVLELMLVHHPLDCPICDKAGECDLQDIAYEYGKPEARFIRHRKEAPPDIRGPLIELTSNRCILCGKCVRVCAEHQAKGALGFIGRGFSTVIQPAFGEILECDYCGQCIDACPTGALLSKPFKFKARAWFLEEKNTICPFCSCGCTLTLGLREGKILRSRGKEGKGVSDGNLCARGRFGFDYIYSENRLTTPMIRKDGELVPVSWEEALAHISSNLKAITKSHGASSIGAIGSHRCTNEDNYVLQKFMRKVVGSCNIDSSAAFGYALVEEAWDMAFSQKGHRINLKSPFGKDVVFIIESDLTVTHPVFGLNIIEAKRQGSNLIVADSRETKLTRQSTKWLRIKQGTGTSLLNGIMKIIIDRSLFDKEKASGISGFLSLESSLKDYTPEKVSRITGISEDELISFAEMYAWAKNRMMSLSMGVSENTKGLDTVLAAANLINLMGDSNEALQIPAEYANTFGLYQVGVRPFEHESGKEVLKMLYGDRSLKSMYLKMLGQDFKALYIMGEDPVVNFQHSSKIIERLKSLDFLVVQDIALTESAKLAQAVLPASSWAEKDGTFVNSEGVTQQLCKAVETKGQALPDWLIIRNLAWTMGKDIGVKNMDDISKEIDSFLNIQPETNNLQPCFNPVCHTSEEEPDKEYPFAMVKRDILQHSGSSSARSKSLALVASEALIEINDKDAERFGIADNTYVRVVSKRGAVYLKSNVTDAVPEGVVFVPAHFPHSRINTLTHYPSNGGGCIDAVRIEAIK